MTDLFDAVRKISPSEAWSRGVTLARRGAVSLESQDEEEIVARIRVSGSTVTPRVALFPEDGEWECDCGSPLDACEHVAAVVIARRQGLESEAERRPLQYRFRRTPEGLFFERGIEEDAEFRPLQVPLQAIASGRLLGPEFEASPEDLAVERALRGCFRGVLDREAVPRIFPALARARGVTLDGRPVAISSAPVLPTVAVEDAPGGGFVLRFAEPRELRERFRNGIVLWQDALRPEGEPGLTAREREDLARGRRYRASEIAELVGEVIPSLRTRVPIEIRTERLPAAVREPPRISLLLETRGDRLRVLPRIVYPSREGVALRDQAAEGKLEEDLLRSLGLRVDREEELPREHAIELVSKLESFEALVEGKGAEDFRLHPRLDARVVLGAEDFEVRFESGARRADPRAVLRGFRGGASLVPLVGGGFAPLPADWLERYGEQLEDLLAARDEAGRLPKASLSDLARFAEDMDAPLPPDWTELRALATGLSRLPEAPLAPSLRAALREYQRAGADWLSFLRRAGIGALLADDMGLGKTVQALAVLEGRSLVAAPTSVLRNWMEEARRFRPDLSLCLYHGRDRKLDASADLTVVSHALLRLDRDVLAAVSWDAVVLDEAQVVRNPETELARAVYSLDARFRMSLTGTPIENRLVDLWSQFHFLNPGFLGGLSSFEDRYVRPVERGEREPLARLEERIRPFFLRRLKSEVAPELPPRTESTLRVELDESERELYEAVRLAARKDVLAKLDRGGSVLGALEALLRLRQAACHPALLPGRGAESSSKTELLLSSLETAASEGHKSLVFSQWTSMLDLLEPHLERAGRRFVRLDGATRERDSVVSRFQNDPELAVFLVSLKAGGTGLNLTAADHVFLFDPWWNPAAEEQAFDRAHRIGQEKPVFLYRLVASDTVEERILDLQKEKRALATMAAGASAPAITREELLRLLE